MTLNRRDKNGNIYKKDKKEVCWDTRSSKIYVGKNMIGYAKTLNSAVGNGVYWAKKRKHFFTIGKKTKKLLDGKRVVSKSKRYHRPQTAALA